jgi:hypothetical protein
MNTADKDFIKICIKKDCIPFPAARRERMQAFMYAIVSVLFFGENLPDDTL